MRGFLFVIPFRVMRGTKQFSIEVPCKENICLLLNLWMFISFDSKRNEPKKTTGYVTFYESYCFSSACATQTFLMPVYLLIVGFLALTL
jgi:hypothetical protein